MIRLVKFLIFKLISLIKPEEAASAIPQTHWPQVVAHIGTHAPNSVLQGFGPLLNRKTHMGNMPMDLPVEGDLGFEHLAGLFSSTSLDHAVVSMPIRQVAYIFGVLRQMNARKVVEIGRYKGGATLAMSSAMQGQGELWSVDIGQKEARLKSDDSKGTYDEMLSAMLDRLDLKNVHILVGDSHTIEIDTGAVDAVFIDGDHSYEGAKNDFDRFGTRVRTGGAVFFDDAFNEDFFVSHSDTVGRLIDEITGTGNYRLVKQVNRLAHLERIR